MPCLVFGFFATIAVFLAPPSSTPPLKSSSVAPAPSLPALSPSATTTAVELGFGELVIADESGTLKPSAKALALEGKRVRLTGFMAELENTPVGGFYLCPLPLHGDESGGGLGDIPAHAVTVRLPYARNLQVPHQRGRIIVTGIFHVGPPTTPDDFIGSFHIAADRPARGKVALKPAKIKRPGLTPRKPAAPRGR